MNNVEYYIPKTSPHNDKNWLQEFGKTLAVVSSDIITTTKKINLGISYLSALGTGIAYDQVSLNIKSIDPQNVQINGVTYLIDELTDSAVTSAITLGIMAALSIPSSSVLGIIGIGTAVNAVYSRYLSEATSEFFDELAGTVDVHIDLFDKNGTVILSGIYPNGMGSISEIDAASDIASTALSDSIISTLTEGMTINIQERNGFSKEYFTVEDDIIDSLLSAGEYQDRNDVIDEARDISLIPQKRGSSNEIILSEENGGFFIGNVRSKTFFKTKNIVYKEEDLNRVSQKIDELIIGTRKDDSIFDHDGDDRVYGLRGDDIFYGGKGADYYIGGEGKDTVSFWYSKEGVEASLQNGNGVSIDNVQGDAKGDTYTEIENLHGSNHDDTLGGDHSNNIIKGHNGKDTLAGYGGDDFLYGGNNSDILYGGSGIDYLYGENGLDLIIGGKEWDVLHGINVLPGKTINSVQYKDDYLRDYLISGDSVKEYTLPEDGYNPDGWRDGDVVYAGVDDVVIDSDGQLSDIRLLFREEVLEISRNPLRNPDLSYLNLDQTYLKGEAVFTKLFQNIYNEKSEERQTEYSPITKRTYNLGKDENGNYQTAEVTYLWFDEGLVLSVEGIRGIGQNTYIRKSDFSLLEPTTQQDFGIRHNTPNRYYHVDEIGYNKKGNPIYNYETYSIEKEKSIIPTINMDDEKLDRFQTILPVGEWKSHYKKLKNILPNLVINGFTVKEHYESLLATTINNTVLDIIGEIIDIITNEETKIEGNFLKNIGYSSVTISQINGSAIDLGKRVTLSSGAEVTLNADGTYQYNPNGAFDALAKDETATDTFSYTIDDGFGGTETLTANITIEGIDTVNNPVSIDGDENDNRIDGDEQDNVINGLAGKDDLFGGKGDDTINGGDDQDTLHGEAGRDIINAGAGTDYIFDSDNEADTVNGGEGIDLLSFIYRRNAVNVDLGKGIDSDGGTMINIENIVGSKFDDIIIGDNIKNFIRGHDGDDIIIGGGHGDVLFGNAGNDNFRYLSADDSTINRNKGEQDTIGGFESGKDTIQLSDSFSDIDDVVITGISGSSLVTVTGTDFGVMVRGDVAISDIEIIEVA